MEQVAEQPVILMDDDIPIHHEVEMVDLPPDDPHAQDENDFAPPNIVEQIDQQDLQVDEAARRRSNREPKYSARYKAFRKSLGLISLIGNLLIYTFVYTNSSPLFFPLRRFQS